MPSKTVQFNRQAKAIERIYQPKSFLDIPSCEFTPNELKIERGLSFDHWQRIGRTLQTLEAAVSWWIGDWLLYGEQEYGQRCYQAIGEATGYEHETIKVAAWVAERFPPVARATEISFSHYKTVAGREPLEAQEWLDKAKDEKLSVKELREQIRESKLRSNGDERMTFFLTGNLTVDGDVELSEAVRGAVTLSGLLTELARMREKVNIRIDL